MKNWNFKNGSKLNTFSCKNIRTARQLAKKYIKDDYTYGVWYSSSSKTHKNKYILYLVENYSDKQKRLWKVNIFIHYILLKILEKRWLGRT